MTYSLNTLTDAAPAASASRPGLARFAHETALVLGAAALVFWLLALVSHSGADAAFSTSGDGGAVRNWGGRLGAWLADASYFLVGYSAWWGLAAGVRAWLASLARWMRAEAPPSAQRGRWLQGRWGFWVGLAVLLLASTVLEWSRLYRFEARLPDHAGGALGWLAGPFAVKWLGFTGSGLLAIALLVSAAALVFRFSWSHVAARSAAAIDAFTKRGARSASSPRASRSARRRPRARGDGAGGTHRDRGAALDPGADRDGGEVDVRRACASPRNGRSRCSPKCRQPPAAGGPARRRGSRQETVPPRRWR